MLHEAVIELLDDEEIGSEDFSDKYGELFRSVQQDCVESTLETYKETAPIALADIRDATKAFEDRNFARWKQSFDHLEMLWTVCQEVGELQGRSAQGKVGDEENVVMAALSYLFPPRAFGGAGSYLPSERRLPGRRPHQMALLA